ncbi:hypothetical protein [Streptomyces sp. RFCAC02]|uniref:hypothetical protein n=1 Tax=Streptomyces sp. RFCAC02 TaxID=2499143 RepID=UPI001020F15A|nr:hypothetical protein [Streptomyces sp. RFCAC02]
MRAGADLRVLRAAVFAAACATLAAAGHLSAGGLGVSAWALAAGWAAAFLVALPLTGRERRSLPALAALLAAGQFLLHGLYSLGATGAGHHGGGAIAQAHRLLCNDHALALTERSATRIVAAAGLDPAAPAADAGGAAHGLLPSGGMLAGHVLAALAAGWLLRRGEAALWRLVRLAARRPFTLGRVLFLARLLCADLLPGVPVVRPARTGHHATPATSGTPLPDVVIRRGPPARTAHLFALAA